MHTATQPRARLSDPQTSHQAAVQAEGVAAYHRRIAVDALRQYGPMGVDQIGDCCNIPGYKFGKRMSELLRLGLVKRTGKRVVSNSGCSQDVWGVEA